MTENLTLAFLANGRSVHTVRWVRHFAERGYDVHLITFTSKPIEGVKIHELRYFGKIAYPMRIWEVMKAVKKIDPDILHAHYISHNGAYGALTGFRPLILSAWGGDISIDPEKSRIRRFLVTFTLKRADLVHTGDNIGKKRLIELGCDAEKILVQPFGVDTKLFSPKARSEALRRELNIDNLYSAILARWWEKKYNVDVFLRAMPLVLSEVPDVKFVMLGGGSLDNKLRQLARKLGVYENIIFIGKVSHEQMPKYLASVDLYVDTSSDYRIGSSGSYLIGRGGSGMGQTTKEAMACAVPQILSDRMSFTACEKFHGLIYKQLDYRDLAEKIVQIIRNRKVRTKIAKESRKTALEIYDQEENLKKWETIYYKLKTSTNL